ncbi:MAG: HAD family hydrolase [Acidimicrobiia bacterium]|nr:HAD family hydrolase [Acidimicrobiia bacterium]
MIGLDGDDTLWESEVHFADVHEVYRDVFTPFVGDGTDVDARLYATERRNLELFGYGAKGFILSMIETAIELSEGAVTSAEITRILALGKGLLSHPVELIDGVADTVPTLAAAGYRLVLVTKGDLFHQEQKVAASGLADHFEQVAIVSEKDERTYRRVLDGVGVEPEDFLMVGNTVRSDVLPVLAIGGRAVQVPHHVTWSHEVVESDVEFPVLSRLADLPGWLESLG